MLSRKGSTAATITPRSRGTAAALALACLLLAGACGQAPAPAGTAREPGPPAAASAAPRGPCGGDILLLTIDTLRPDHLSLYGYPRPTSPGLERWFADAAVFARAYSTTASTPLSTASFLSGLLPQEHGVRLFYQLLPAETRILPDLLPPCYQSAAFVSNVVLTDEAMGMAGRFDHFDDYLAEREPRRPVYERSAAATTDAVLAWLAAGRDLGRSLFLWVHYIDPHGPYLPPARWPRSFGHDEPLLIPLERVPDYQRLPGVEDGLAYVDLYDEEIAYMDAEVDRLLAGYARGAPWEEALVLFTADHGESMMEHERWFSHGYQVYEEIVRVPLVLRGPGVAAGRREELASGVDVAVTALAFAGAGIPQGSPGRDLRAPGAGLGERPVFVEAFKEDRHWRGVIQGSEKWVAQVSAAGEILAPRYFDLEADPGELAPGSWPPGRPPALAELLALIAADPDPGGVPAEFLQGEQLAGPKIDPRASPEALEKLKALGYVQ